MKLRTAKKICKQSLSHECFRLFAPPDLRSNPTSSEVGKERDMPEYETRVTRVHVLPKGDQLFSELATVVETDDEAAGEFVTVRQQAERDHETHQCIRIDPEEWAAIREAIDTAIGQCRSYL